MSEKRRPDMILFAEIHGKSNKKRRVKVEAFHVSLWDGSSVQLDCKHWGKTIGDRYRIRVDGKWFKGRTLTVSELFVMFRRSVVGVRSKFRAEPNERAQ